MTNQLPDLPNGFGYEKTNLEKVAEYTWKEMTVNANGWVRRVLKDTNVLSSVNIPSYVIAGIPSQMDSKIIAYALWGLYGFL